MEDKEKRLDKTILIVEEILEKSNKTNTEEYKRIQKLIEKRKIKSKKD